MRSRFAARGIVRGDIPGSAPRSSPISPDEARRRRLSLRAARRFLMPWIAQWLAHECRRTFASSGSRPRTSPGRRSGRRVRIASWLARGWTAEEAPILFGIRYRSRRPARWVRTRCLPVVDFPSRTGRADEPECLRVPLTTGHDPCSVLPPGRAGAECPRRPGPGRERLGQQPARLDGLGVGFGSHAHHRPWPRCASPCSFRGTRGGHTGHPRRSAPSDSASGTSPCRMHEPAPGSVGGEAARRRRCSPHQCPAQALASRSVVVVGTWIVRRRAFV